MRATLRATTAILASLTLVTPTHVSAQTGGTSDGREELCIDGTAPPCAEATPEGDAATEADQTSDARPEADPSEPAQADETPPAEGAADPASNTPSEPSVAEERPVDTAPAPEVPQAAPDAEVAEEAPAEEPAPVDSATQSESASDTAAEKSADEPVETPAEQPAISDDSTPAELPIRPEANTVPADAAMTPEEPAAQSQASPDNSAASVEAPTAPSAAALAADEDGNTDADAMETETITEETARSSDEDFTGGITSEAGTAAVAPTSDDGLSKFEKALLLGAGALAVGAIVRGNREVVGTSQDRLVVSRSDGNLEILKDDNALLRQAGSQVQTRTFDDGSTRTITTRADGSQVITVRDADLRVVRRVLVRTDGTEVRLIDDTAKFEPVDVTRLPPPAPAISAEGSENALRAALEREGAFDRQFSLAQIRQISEVRKLAPAIEVDTITFETGSAAIRPEQARGLTELGNALSRLIARNPNEVFLVEGHTDAVGSASTNLILSDRRAESLALALTEYFAVPPENLVVQGYGESDLRIATDTDERANRRAGVRRITQLMQVVSR
jgi:outer membrane protein OmpA-like peptidoglycan-associated protein